VFEQALEDLLVGGFGAIEMEATGDELNGRFTCGPWTARPSRSTSPGTAIRPRRATRRLRGNLGTQTLIPLLDDELMYHAPESAQLTRPSGSGRLEVAFETVNHFLAANRYASDASPPTRWCSTRCG
jgi:hypothetical protein